MHFERTVDWIVGEYLNRVDERSWRLAGPAAQATDKGLPDRHPIALHFPRSAPAEPAAHSLAQPFGLVPRLTRQAAHLEYDASCQRPCDALASGPSPRWQFLHPVDIS